MGYEIEELTQRGWEVVRGGFSDVNQAAEGCESMLADSPGGKLRVVEVERMCIKAIVDVVESLRTAVLYFPGGE